MGAAAHWWSRLPYRRMGPTGAFGRPSLFVRDGLAIRPLGDVVLDCYLSDYQRKEVVRISSSSSCGTLEVAGR